VKEVIVPMAPKSWVEYELFRHISEKEMDIVHRQQLVQKF
jgi:hypothetical protein